MYIQTTLNELNTLIYNNTIFTIYNTEHEFNVHISLHTKMKSQEARVHCLE